MKLDVAGERIELLPDRAVLWPGGGGGAVPTVLVADVHIGKTDTFRAFGLPLPDVDLDADLARLTALVRRTRACRLLILGDFVHAAAGLNEQVIDQVSAWRAALDADVELVPGNHDQSAMGPRGSRAQAPDVTLPSGWGITLRPDAYVDGPFRFCHHPQPGDGAYTWCGHLHPAVIVGSGRLADRLPCFWLGATLGVLPAFGSFTGGRAVHPEPGDRLVAVTPEGLVMLAPARAAARGGGRTR